MNNQARAVSAAIALWLVVVAGGSTVGWLVIDRAGRGVFSPRANGAMSPSTSAPTPSGTPPTPTVSSQTGTGSQGPAGAATSPSPAPSTSSRPPTRTSPTATAPLSRDSVTVAGGTVEVACQGSAPTLRYATPRDGWSMQLQREPGQLSVTFRQQQGAGESEIQATCRGGQPTFETSSASTADS